MFDRVLIAIDRSPQASGVIAAASSVASADHSDLMVVHVQEPITAETGGHVEAMSDCEELVGWALDELEKKGLHGSGACLPYSLRETAQGHRIAHAAREFHADLVVLGSHGHSRIGELMAGSVTRTVIKDAPCSVLIVR